MPKRQYVKNWDENGLNDINGLQQTKLEQKTFVIKPHCLTELGPQEGDGLLVIFSKQ